MGASPPCTPRFARFARFAAFAAMAIDKRKRRYGPAPLPSEQRRAHCVSVRLSPAELAELDRQRGNIQRGAWLRMAWQRSLPPAPPPAINRGAWAELARASANLNQIAHHLNSSVASGAPVTAADVADVARALARFRASLIGARLDDGGEP